MFSSFPRFRFQLKFKSKSRNFCNSTKFELPAIDDPGKFLVYVRQQCRLGFVNLQIPKSLFNQMISLPYRPSLLHFTRLFAAMLKLKRLNPHSTVISLSSRLELSGTRPDLYSVGILANCYAQLGRVDLGFSLLGKSLKLGCPFESNRVLFTILINGFVRNNRVSEAVKVLEMAVFKLGIRPDIVTYGTIVKCLCKVGDNAGALHLLDQMHSLPSCCKPDIVIYNTIIDTLCKGNSLHEALELFGVMKNEGIVPNEFVYTSLIRGMFKLGRKRDGQKMLVEMIECNVEPDVTTYSMLVDMHCKDGMLVEARAVIGVMHVRGVALDVLTYTALLDGYCLGGEMDKARKVFDVMVESETLCCRLDVVSYSTLINGYVKARRLDKALEILQRMFDRGISPNVIVYSTVIDGLCKTGRIRVAREVFNDMKIHGIKPDVCTYGALLDGLCKNKQLHEAVELLTEMESNGVAPDSVIYNILIHSSSQFGHGNDDDDDDDEKFVHNFMSKCYISDHKTYMTMINGCCEKGLMSTATDLLEKMKQSGCSPDAVTYNTIVKGFILKNDLKNALSYRDLMVSMGFEPDVSTMSLLVARLSRDKTDPEFLQKFVS